MCFCNWPFIIFHFTLYCEPRLVSNMELGHHFLKRWTKRTRAPALGRQARSAQHRAPSSPPRENLEGEDAPSFAYPSFMALDVYSSEKSRASFKPIISENESFLSTPLTQRAATGIRAGLDFALTVPGVAVRGPLSPQGSRHGQAGSTSIQSSY